MNISKTIFKEYSRCPKVYALDQIYKDKQGAKISIFEQDKYDKIHDILSSMFDDETGEDLITTNNPQLEALLPYYNQLEEEAMTIAQRKFQTDILYSLETKNQKKFDFTDEYGNNFYCYLDGYKELDDEILIFEVKATTSKKFIEMSYSENKKKIPVFIDINGIYTPNPEALNEKVFNKLYNRYNDIGKYVFDIAIERYIITNSIKQKYPKLADKKLKFYLVVLNTNYRLNKDNNELEVIYNPDINGNELVSFIDMSYITENYYKDMEDKRKKINEYIKYSDLENVKLGDYCERKKQTKCTFCRVCYKELLKQGSILEYVGNHHGFKDETGTKYTIFELVNRGMKRLDSIPEAWISNPNQLIQRKCYETNNIYWNKEKLKKALKLITYPIYHLDFESFPCPLPRFNGENPYMQSLFQFSIHVEKEPGICDKVKDHYGFLAIDFLDRREELIQEMIKVIDLTNGGTVLVYNKNFEYTRINELIRLFPQYKEKLEKINNHMFDLLDLLKAKSSLYMSLGYSEEESKINNFYHNNLCGSYSIKKVLPVFSTLTYKGMIIANGTDAIAAYASFRNLPKEEIEEIRKQLIEYCRQDTWAMVVILNEIIKIVK